MWWRPIWSARACSSRSTALRSSTAPAISTRRRASRTGARSTPRRWWWAGRGGRRTAASSPSFACGTCSRAGSSHPSASRSAQNEWRRLGHLVADQVYQRLTGEKGYFDTQIVFVDETGPKDRRIKRLAIMDQDGANVRLLSQGRELVLTPRFSPTSQEITFMQYTGDQPRVFLMNLETGKRELVGDFPGMTFAPRFSPTASASS